MARKVIIDCDMGTDDAVALCLALVNPDIDLIAVTACEGCVSSEQANNNLQAILTQVDPDRYPRLGLSTPANGAPPISTSFLYGDDGLGNTDFPVSPLQHVQHSEKVIIDLVRANPGEVTILCLGPLTNLARVFQREPALAGEVHRVIATGGCVQAPGNVTPVADFNFYFDPESARKVLQSRTSLSIIPLDVTSQITFGLDFLNNLPGEHTRVGHFLHQILPHAFRTYRQKLGREVITLNDAIGCVAMLRPDLFEFEEMACDVETQGELTRGATIFDRRVPAEWSSNVEVARAIDIDAVQQAVFELITLAGSLTPR